VIFISEERKERGDANTRVSLGLQKKGRREALTHLFRTGKGGMQTLKGGKKPDSYVLIAKKGRERQSSIFWGKETTSDATYEGGEGSPSSYSRGSSETSLL